MRGGIRLASALSLFAVARSAAQSNDTTTTRTFSGFVDTYYAWDFNRPRTFDRAFTTQPARHAEANVNLAYVDAKWSGPRYRGRLALQWGTSVQSNYAAEPRTGSVSGPSVSQFIQEAVVGYQLAPSLWLDGGVFLAHVGTEGWISRDNLSYTRSLVADFSPYYESGAKLTWSATPKLTATLALLNGWQNISAENSEPAGGVRFDYAATPALTFTYDNFVGNVAPDSDAVRVRSYHDAIVQYNRGKRWKLAAMYSLGTESKRASDGGIASWWGMAALAKYAATPTLAIVGRVERYADPSQVIVVTSAGDSFRTNGASLGVDVNLGAPVLWRTEVRRFDSSDAVWPLHRANHFGASDTFFVSSLALTF